MRLLLNKRKVNDTWKIFGRLLFLKWGNEIISDKGNTKISIIEVYIFKYYFESHLKYKRRYYIQNIFHQLNIMVSYVDIIGVWLSIAFC